MYSQKDIDSLSADIQVKDSIIESLSSQIQEFSENESKSKYSLKNESSFNIFKENDRTILNPVNSSYDFAYTHINKEFSPIVISKQTNTKYTYGDEGSIAEILIKAYQYKDFQKSFLWEKKYNYNEGEIYNRNCYKLIDYGCCGAASTFLFLDLFTGKELFLSTHDFVEIYNHNEGNVFLVSYLSRESMKFEFDKYPKNVTGIFQIYNMNLNYLRSWIVESNDESLFLWPELFFESDKPDHIVMDYGVISKNQTYHFVFKYAEEKKIKIQIGKNGLDLEDKNVFGELTFTIIK